MTLTPASWADRAGAFCIDVMFGLAAAAVLLLVGWSAPLGGWLWWLCVVVAAALLLAIAVNRLVLPVLTGWSVGRGVFGIAVLDRDGDRPGPWRLLLRDLAHLLDTVPLLLGWAWPLLDSRGRTFADIVTRTEVRREPDSHTDLRKVAIAVVAGAAGLAALAAAIGYFGIYRQQTAEERARAQISAEGPKIVADMLSYSAKTIDEDFARDQTLVTDAYRQQLTDEQNAVRKTGPVDNEYWARNSAVLSASADHAAMLLLLQGQRGTESRQRLITASVRVDFVKSGSGQWQIDNLTVLRPAQSPPAPAPPAPSKTSAPPTPSKTPPAKTPPKGPGR